MHLLLNNKLKIIHHCIYVSYETKAPISIHWSDEYVDMLLTNIQCENMSKTNLCHPVKS